MSTGKPGAPTRRNFFRLCVAAAGGSAASCMAETGPAPPRAPVMPPGAVSRSRFAARCTACHLCVARCPAKILRPAVAEYGWKGILQPRMDFSKNACDPACRVCSQVCPTDALVALTADQKRRVRVGLAEFSWSRCVVRTEHRACGDCARACPTGAITLRAWRSGLDRPVFRPEPCTGCGACEAACPARPVKALLVAGLETHEWVATAEADR